MDLLRLFTLTTATAISLTVSSHAQQPEAPVKIGTRRELFVEDSLIARLDGGATLRLHHPVPQEVVLVLDSPWEGSGGSGYAAGELRVEIQDLEGRPFPGFSLEECQPSYGDTVARNILWKDGPDVSQLAGKPVRLRFALKDADLYSYRFQDWVR